MNRVLRLTAFSLLIAATEIAAALPLGCSFSDTSYPDAPIAGVEAVTFFGSRSGATFTAVFWRLPCGPARIDMKFFLRITPMVGSPSFCTGDFTALVGGIEYRLGLGQAGSDHGPCGPLYTPTTFRLIQYLSDGIFDYSSALTLIYHGSPNDTRAELPAAGTAAAATVVEYYWATRDHYFISANPAEIAALDSAPPGGWTRTGQSFKAYTLVSGSAGPVCRFYIPAAYGDSHYFSASPAECAAVHAKFPMLIYETPNAFNIYLPDLTTGVCPAGTMPVYRLWNNRADTNHRYTTSLTVRDQMLANGYLAEGYGPGLVSMCAPQ